VTLPRAPLAGSSLRLDPITPDDAGDLESLARDEEVCRFTRVPSKPREGFGAEWAARYVQGWQDGSRAGYAIRAVDGAFLGLAMFVRLDHEALEGEIGYAVGSNARGRGVATVALRVLTAWGFAELGLERIELRIDDANEASARVAASCGYTREGILRNTHLKETLRGDVGVWSRLRSD
jgi:RimJ/RimL family protein N-acetyltransferase